MSKERELLKRSVRIIESLGPDYEAYNLIDKIEELLTQPEHIPDVGNMVTQEPVYWENEKKALLNEIDHLTNRPAQPDNHEEHKLGVETYFSYEDSRYPILVLRSEQFGSVGYNLDLRNGDLSRVCLCHAHSENECLCSAWSIDDE